MLHSISNTILRHFIVNALCLAAGHYNTVGVSTHSKLAVKHTRKILHYNYNCIVTQRKGCIIITIDSQYSGEK